MIILFEFNRENALGFFFLINFQSFDLFFGVSGPVFVYKKEEPLFDEFKLVSETTNVVRLSSYRIIKKGKKKQDQDQTFPQSQSIQVPIVIDVA
jgi:hypothetical protein